MSKETITLVPAGGSPLVLDGDILVVQANWGDHEVEVQLAQGPGIDGAIAGTRNRVTREVELQLVVDATSESFVSAQAALERAVALLADRGGLIVRQRTLESGEVLGPVEAEVLTAALSAPDDFLLQRTLRLTCQPLWLGRERVIASLEGSTESIHTLSLTGVKGNLPGPGRIAIRDREGEARRFAEIGQSWTHPAEQIEFGASDVDPVAGSLSGDVVELTPLVHLWQTVAELTDLNHKGSFRVRVRASHDSEATVRQRVAYRIGGGAWRALDSVTLQAGDAWDLDLGAIHHHGDGQLDVRVQVSSDQIDTSATYSLARVTLMPTERYAVARGLIHGSEPTEILAYDDFTQESVLLEGEAAPLGGEWKQEGGVNTPWRRMVEPGVWRWGGLGGDFPIGAIAYLDGEQYTDVVVEATCEARWAMTGVVARFVDSENYLRLTVAKGQGSNVIVEKIKDGWRTTLAGVPAKAPAVVGSTAIRARLRLEVDSQGNWRASVGTPEGEGMQVVMEGTDSDLAAGGVLASGYVGIASLFLGDNGYSSAFDFAAYATAENPGEVAVVRANGLGVFTDTTAYTADAAHQDPAPIADYRGHRVMIPPGDSQLAVKLRRTNLDAEPDSGPDDDEADITVYHRPAFVTLPGEVAQEEGILL